MKLGSRFLLGLLIVLLTSCGFSDSNETLRIFSYNFDFSDSDHNWKHGFAEYSAKSEDTVIYQLRYRHTAQPRNINENRKALMLSGYNESQDLFMYLKKQIKDLEPNTPYYVTLEVELASDAKDVSGPGQQIFLKVGASEKEPLSILDGDYYRMNIDKGNQKDNGQDMVCIGNIAVPENTSGFAVISNSNSPYNKFYNAPIVVKSDSNGELWLIVGTDSSVKEKTTIYYTKIGAIFSLTK